MTTDDISKTVARMIADAYERAIPWGDIQVTEKRTTYLLVVLCSNNDKWVLRNLGYDVDASTVHFFSDPYVLVSFTSRRDMPDGYLRPAWLYPDSPTKNYRIGQ